MKREVLFVILDNYADWESAFLAPALNTGVRFGGETTKYVSKTVAPTLDGARSIGGFRTAADYDFDSMPDDYAALVLVGGLSWQSPEAERLIEIVRKATADKKIVGAICNGASFLAAHGFLNHVRHTGNTVEQLELWGGANYTNRAGYVEAQAVADGGIVTANGSGYLEFAREMLLALEVDDKEHIEAWYGFNRNGLYNQQNR